MYNIKNVAVIGAGTMGNGIAQVFATYGFHVNIFDESTVLLEKALNTIKKNSERLHTKQLISALQLQQVQNNVFPYTSLEETVSQSDLVIEVITENFEAKKQLFIAIEKHCKPSCIIASNTSSISITKLGAVLQNPSRVIGMHFMNPAPVMILVEVITGLLTSKEVKTAIHSLTLQLQKTPVFANDYPGFVANRILMPMINEAVHTLNDGVSSVEGIDQIMKLGMAHPMGPLELADFIGLDVCLYILNVLHHGLGEAKYAPCPLLVKMVDAKLLGIKTQHGFYRYVEGSKEKKVSEIFSH